MPYCRWNTGMQHSPRKRMYSTSGTPTRHETRIGTSGLAMMTIPCFRLNSSDQQFSSGFGPLVPES